MICCPDDTFLGFRSYWLLASEPGAGRPASPEDPTSGSGAVGNPDRVKEKRETEDLAVETMASQLWALFREAWN